MYEILTIILFVTIIIQGVYNIRLSKLQRMRINALYTKLGEEQDEVQAAKIGLTDYKNFTRWFLQPILFDEKTKNWVEQKNEILQDKFITGLTLEEKRLLINRLYNSNHSYQAVRRQVYRLENEDK